MSINWPLLTVIAAVIYVVSLTFIAAIIFVENDDNNKEDK